MTVKYEARRTFEAAVNRIRPRNQFLFKTLRGDL